MSWRKRLEPLIDKGSLQAILERGLVTGKWSIAQFNRRDYWTEIKAKAVPELILPRGGFLQEHPQFLDRNFRDLPAFERANHRSAF